MVEGGPETFANQIARAGLEADMPDEIAEAAEKSAQASHATESMFEHMGSGLDSQLPKAESKEEQDDNKYWRRKKA